MQVTTWAEGTRFLTCKSQIILDQFYVFLTTFVRVCAGGRACGEPVKRWEALWANRLRAAVSAGQPQEPDAVLNI